LLFNKKIYKHLFLKILLNFSSFNYFISKYQEPIDFEEYKIIINKIIFLGAVRCLVRCTPSLLQSVITCISQHIGDRELLLL